MPITQTVTKDTLSKAQFVGLVTPSTKPTYYVITQGHIIANHLLAPQQDRLDSDNLLPQPSIAVMPNRNIEAHIRDTGLWEGGYKVSYGAFDMKSAHDVGKKRITHVEKLRAKRINNRRGPGEGAGASVGRSSALKRKSKISHVMTSKKDELGARTR